MPAWIPIATMVLPALTSLAEKALPAFTSRKDHAKSLDEHSSHIAELQVATTQNAEALQAIIEQIKQTVLAVDAGASKVEQRFNSVTNQLQQVRNIAIAASIVAIVATGAACFALFR